MEFQSDMAEQAYKEHKDELEPIRTISRVPGNPNYYEKNGLRTFGDNEDHEHEPKMSFSRALAFIAMAFLWSGSQIPLYLFGSVIPLIVQDVGGVDRYPWILLANLIPLASITPFVGALSDLFGRKWVACFGALCGVIGNIVTATASTMNIVIGGQVLVGIGAGINELVALAVAGELAPTRKRGIYIGGMVCTIAPYTMSGMYAQLVAVNGSWRWIGLWCGVWSFIGLVLTVLFYNPGPRVNATGLTRMEVAKRIDYIGGILSTAGVTLLIASFTWGGNQYSWGSAHVLSSLILGIVLLIAFIAWEFVAPWPMFPARLKIHPRALYLILFITFVSGSNFISVLVFWTIQYQNVYGIRGQAVHNSLGSLPVGFGIIGGGVIASLLITFMKGKIRLIMFVSCVIMTAGNGALAAARIDNLPDIWFPLTLACLGVGAVIIPNQVIASIVCPDDLIATITACTISIRILGGAVGYAAYYNILLRNYKNIATSTVINVLINFPDFEFTYPNVYAVVQTIAADASQYLLGKYGITTQAQVDALAQYNHETFAVAASEVYLISIAFGGASIIASAFLPDIGQFMDDHVAVQYA